MDLDDLFELGDASQAKLDPGLPTASKVAKALDDADLDVDIAARAKEAASAHDAFSAAKAVYDAERTRLQESVDESLRELRERMVRAREAEMEAVRALGEAMENGGITTIPMTDRPDIRLKPIPGKKKGITRGWLVDPDNIAVSAYEEALSGNPTIKSGKDFAGKLWDAQPKSEDSKTVIVPDAYEDEPDRN